MGTCCCSINSSSPKRNKAHEFVVKLYLFKTNTIFQLHSTLANKIIDKNPTCKLQPLIPIVQKNDNDRGENKSERFKIDLYIMNTRM